ncbi:ABC transporter substrate-binding protein [Patescibacteria group bacterium]|nr:ABC transporter substrate-binding protein [Patescibacteria group bacterium]
MNVTTKFILAAAVIVALTVLWVSSSMTPKSTEEVVMGATLPLSGDLAFLGEGYKNGMELALSELQDTTFTYKIIYEDDRFDPKTGATTASKLLSVNKVDGIFSFGSPVGNVVSPLAEDYKIVHINGIASDQNVAVGRYNFVHWTPPYKESELLIQELQKRGIQSVAIIAANQPGTLAVATQVEKDISNSDVTLAGYEMYNPGETDMRTQIAKLKTTNADIYMLVSMSPELEIITHQMRELGVTAPLTSIESFEWTTQPELFEGMWFVNAADPTTEFVAKYEARYGTAPTVGAANGYDAVMLFVKGVESAAQGVMKPTSEQVTNALHNIRDHKGAVGELSVDDDGLVVSEPVVRTIQNGKPMTIK